RPRGILHWRLRSWMSVQYSCEPSEHIPQKSILSHDSFLLSIPKEQHLARIARYCVSPDPLNIACRQNRLACTDCLVRNCCPTSFPKIRCSLLRSRLPVYTRKRYCLFSCSLCAVWHRNGTDLSDRQ